MAAKEINAGGGIKVGDDSYMLNVIAYDDKANPTEASNAVRKLIDRDGVKYILGFCCSGATGAVASFIENEDAVMLVGNAAERSITTCEVPNLTRTRPPTTLAPRQGRSSPKKATGKWPFWARSTWAFTQATSMPSRRN